MCTINLIATVHCRGSQGEGEREREREIEILIRMLTIMQCLQMDLTIFTKYQPYQSNVLTAIMRRGTPKPTKTISTAMMPIKIPAHVGEPTSVRVCVLVL